MRPWLRIVIFFGMLAVLFGIVLLVFPVFARNIPRNALIVSGRFTPLLVCLNELVLLLPVLGATIAMSRLENCGFGAYGLRGPRRFRRLGGGLISGFAALSLVAYVLLLTRHGVIAPNRSNIRYGIEWLGASLLTGFTEELAFRGYLLKTLGDAIGFWRAALITSVVFAAMHGFNQGETIAGLLGLAAAGMVLCLGIRWTGSLWWAIGFHGGWDYAENFAFGTHDSGSACYGALMNFTPRGDALLSGGAAGPEASVFNLCVLALAGIVLWRISA